MLYSVISFCSMLVAVVLCARLAILIRATLQTQLHKAEYDKAHTYSLLVDAEDRLTIQRGLLADMRHEHEALIREHDRHLETCRAELEHMQHQRNDAWQKIGTLASQIKALKTRKKNT